MEKYIVEFWAMPYKDVKIPGDTPHKTDCTSLEQAVALEQSFHAVGWAARVVTIRETRDFPTAGRR